MPIMKFCPECGSQLQIESAKFCPNCGFNLANAQSDNVPDKSAQTAIAPAEHPNEAVIYATSQSEEVKEERPLSIYKLGTNLEEMTEKILQSMGYETERRRKLEDKNGSKHEIDIFATKGSKIRAAECKNYDPSRSVGIKEFRDFHSKLTALKIKDALFVTNTSFSSESVKFAQGANIMLWDGNELRERFFTMSLGRMGASEQSILESALPVNLTYTEVTRLELANPELAKITARLVWHPYYKIDYKVDVDKVDPTRGKHKVQVNSTYIVDALDGEIINLKDDSLTGLVSGFFKKSEEKIAKQEDKQITEDLLSLRIESKYRVEQTSDYAVTRLKPEIKSETAQRAVIQQIISDTKRDDEYEVRTKYGTETKKFSVILKPNDIIVKKVVLVYVPKWNLDIETGQITYMRKALASSKTILVDTISICPRHFSFGNIQLIKKQTYAICNECTGAFCREHIFQVDSKYYCEEHNPNKPQVQESAADQTVKKAEDTVKKAMSGFGSFFKK